MLANATSSRPSTTTRAPCGEATRAPACARARRRARAASVALERGDERGRHGDQPARPAASSPSFANSARSASTSGIAGRQQLVAVEDRVGAGEEAQRLHRVAQLAPAGRQPHHRLRHRDARDGDRAHELERIERRVAAEAASCSGVPSTCTRWLIGTDSGYGSRLASCAISPARCARDSPMPTMPPQQTWMPASRTRVERVEPILVVARRDRSRRRTRARCRDCGCSSRGPASRSASAWPSFSMPSVQQVSSPSAFTSRTIASTGARSRSFGPRHAAPMQKRVAPAAFAARAAATTASTSSSASFGDAGVIARRLRAVAAVLGTAAGLDRDAASRAARRSARDARDAPPARETGDRGTAARTAPRRAATVQRAGAGAGARRGVRRVGRRSCVRRMASRRPSGCVHGCGSVGAIARVCADRCDCDYNRRRVSREVRILSNSRARNI